MNVLDLFSGIGGFSLGLERAGMRTIGFCEIEPYCQKVLKKHWPNTPIYTDIRKLTKEEVNERVDVVCGGFPCQPFSVAGRKKGTEDDRDLWPEMFRVIQEQRPTWVIGENVANFTGMAFQRTKVNLESEGYKVLPFVIPACGIEARHRRDRVWIIAHSDRPKLRKQSGRGSRTSREDSIQSELISENGNATNTNGKGIQGFGECGVRKEAMEIKAESESFYSRPEWTTIREWRAFESPVHGVAHGVPNRVDRIKSLGNAVVPQIPEIIGRAIMTIENKESND